jgi:hypothetical protein
MMTQDQFYKQWPIERATKEGRLIADLREQGFSWAQIDTVFASMTYPQTPYAGQWRLAVPGYPYGDQYCGRVEAAR